MKRTVIGFLIILFASALFADYGRGKRYYDKGYFGKNFYIYSMLGSLNADEGWDSGYKYNRGKVIVGGGFVFLRIGKQMSLGLEFDYTGELEDREYNEPDLTIYNYSLSFGYTLGHQQKAHLFLNMGVANFNYEDYRGRENDHTTFAIGGGLKYAITRNIAFRTDLRLYFDIRDREGDYYYDDYYDDYYYYSDDDRFYWRAAGVSVSAGVELRF